MVGSKCWVIFFMLAMVMVAESSSMTSDDPITWEEAALEGNNNGYGFQAEMLMDSESNRRMLKKDGPYFSYAALRANAIPCGRRGKSYYDCQKRERANPYTRGCSVITKCYRWTH